MISEIIIHRFKKFRQLKGNLHDRMVLAGPNNSGKTTLLQAVAVWSELAEIWFRNNALTEDLKSHSYHQEELDIADIRSLALSNFQDLWHNQISNVPITIKVTTSDWQVGFNINYQDATTATFGLLPETSTNDVKACSENPLTALYIPSLSGLDIHEPAYEESVFTTRLAHSKAGTVLRNLILAVSRDPNKWESLQDTVRSLFNCELSHPSGTDPIQARYRHTETGNWFDLIGGASGFLQSVLIKAALLQSDARLYLLDEPDAHLHVLLKDEIYRVIREHCEQTNSQVLMASHSSRFITAAEKDDRLFIVAEESVTAIRRQEAKQLMSIPTQQIVLAETTQRVLYLEGKTDLDLLRAWAKVLRHPAEQWLDAGCWIATAEEPRRNQTGHFRALKSQVPKLRAIEIRDRNHTDSGPWQNIQPGVLHEKNAHRDMKLVYWSRYEIENYLIHPPALLRIVYQKWGDEAMQKAKEHMEMYFPPILFSAPFERSNADTEKGKLTIKALLTAADVYLNESSYYQIAAAMHPDEVHSDVVTMLNHIESQFADE